MIQKKANKRPWCHYCCFREKSFYLNCKSEKVFATFWFNELNFGYFFSLLFVYFDFFSRFFSFLCKFVFIGWRLAKDRCQDEGHTRALNHIKYPNHCVTILRKFQKRKKNTIFNRFKNTFKNHTFTRLRQITYTQFTSIRT